MSYQSEGWTVDKKRIALMLYQDKTKVDLVDDSFVDDGITDLITALNRIRAGLADKVDKTDRILNLAIRQFVCCEMVRAGVAFQKTNLILREKMETMSVEHAVDGYGKVNTTKPKDWCSLALDTVNDYAISKGIKGRRLKVFVSNARAKIWSNIYNELTDDYGWGE